MRNIEQLIWLADNAGFETHCQPDGNEFDICVATLTCDAKERFAPLNANENQSQQQFERNLNLLREDALTLSDCGLLFVYGEPARLTRYAAALSDALTLRYWIAVRAVTASRSDQMRPEHQGLLLLSKTKIAINSIRIAHSVCRACGKLLKDWGGKSHLMSPQGVALSDVWMDVVVDAKDALPAAIFERILQLTMNIRRRRLLLLTLEEQAQRPTIFQEVPLFAFDPLKWMKREAPKKRAIPDALLNQIHRGKCLDLLKRIPSQTVDLAFADPPFNLTKAYSSYTDEREPGDYIGWCKRWLVEYVRVLKEGGAIFVLNLPKWSVHLADFLCRERGMYLQNWIVWNSLPEPKGVLMPAHYSLLYFTKGKTAARFNYCSMENGWQPFDEAVFPPDRPDVCKRRACVRRRRASASTWRGELTDIWHDIPRDRRNNRRAALMREHPCPTPEALLDRLMRLTTNADDVVLDAFAGVGTTALVAERLNRKYIAIEQDEQYIFAAEQRIRERKETYPQAAPRRKRGVSKRKLQLEVKRLAMALGRVPTRADVEELGEYSLDQFDYAFASWAEALKAAKLYVPPIGQMLSQMSDQMIGQTQLCKLEPPLVSANLQVVPEDSTLPTKQSETLPLIDDQEDQNARL
jgi:DNA modification methylase